MRSAFAAEGASEHSSDAKTRIPRIFIIIIRDPWGLRHTFCSRETRVLSGALSDTYTTDLSDTHGTEHNASFAVAHSFMPIAEVSEGIFSVARSAI